jgi:hypothetical protein
MSDFEYFSDRERGPRPRVNETIPGPVASALGRILDVGIRTNLYALDFPLRCPDGRGPVGCDRDSLMQVLAAEIPDLAWPTETWGTEPQTLPLLDVVEFLHRHAATASRTSYHPHFGHYHLRFDRDGGRAELRSAVNLLLSRNGLAYELDEVGQITRLTSVVVEQQLRIRLPATSDASFDSLLEVAARKYTSSDPAVRRDAVEKLWDAFERSKTILDADKRRGAGALVARSTDTPHEAAMLETEMRELTRIGNEFAVRHHETNTTPPGDETVDHLFARMYALLLRVHPALR